jgi:hypothetical protein
VTERAKKRLSSLRSVKPALHIAATATASTTGACLGQASHASRDTVDPAAMDTAKVENAFTGFPLPQAGHFAG